MAVQRALGVAGGARRVAERGRGVLVEFGPFAVAVLLRQQVVEAQQVRDAGGRRHLPAMAHQHEVAHRRQLRCELLGQRQQAGVKAQHLVLGVVGDPFDLLGEQARVDRVAHAARAGRAVVDLHVAMAVPGQRGHAVSGRDVQRPEHLGELARALLDLAPVRAVDVALATPGHDLDVARMARRVPDQRRHGQRHVHHLAHQDAHRSLLVVGLRARIPTGGCHSRDTRKPAAPALL